MTNWSIDQIRRFQGVLHPASTTHQMLDAIDLAQQIEAENAPLPVSVAAMGGGRQRPRRG